MSAQVDEAMANSKPNNYHYYASTAVSWATGSTRHEAIARAARIAGSDIIKRNVKSQGGLYCWSCRVLAPEAQSYTINFYQPEFITVLEEGTGQYKSTGVPIPKDRAMGMRIQNIKGHVILDEKEEML
jgi:hypothetical protein